MNQTTALYAMLSVGLALILVILLVRPPMQDTQRDVVVVQREDEDIVPTPYWTVYGLPTYWPMYLSPYWYYDVPWRGPIQNPTHGYRRPLYKPHGARPGYTGVAAGGFGGGGHGGGGH